MFLGALPGAMEHVMQIKPKHSQQRTCREDYDVLPSAPAPHAVAFMEDEVTPSKDQRAEPGWSIQEFIWQAMKF